MTLIRSNPEFKPLRNKLIHDKFNTKGESLEVVSKIVRECDVYSNKKSEVTMLHVPSYMILHDILINLNEEVTFNMLKSLDAEIQQLFLDYPPIPYDDNTLKVLQNLAGRKGTNISILSNTGFIHGSTIVQVLAEMGIYDLFAFEIFSDVKGMSKPNPDLFQETWWYAYLNSGEDEAKELKVYHVGDNVFADGECDKTTAPIEFIQINTNDKTIIDLL